MRPVSSVVDYLDRFHARAVSNAWLQLFTAVVRVLLALAFTPSGLVKVLGKRFTLLPATTPVGAFFEGFFYAQGYYQFVGWAQLIAAALLLFPRTATLGAVIYFPIIVNVFVITVAVDFRGTQVMTGAMVLANFHLLCWDYDRLKMLLPFQQADSRHVRARITLALMASAIFGFAGLTQLHLALLRNGNKSIPIAAMIAGLIIGLASLVSAKRRYSPATQEAICSRVRQ